MKDTEFRERVRRAYMITMAACLNMREGLARIRMGKAFRETSEHFADPVKMAAQVAFQYGREYGKWEAGAIDSIDLSNSDVLAADVKASPDLKQQLAELREVAGEVTRRVADALHEATYIAHAADLMAHWEGFGRFCRELLGVEPLVMTMAFGLGNGDPAADIRAARGDAEAHEAEVERWTAEWSWTWRRRFEK